MSLTSAGMTSNFIIQYVPVFSDNVLADVADVIETIFCNLVTEKDGRN